MADKFEGTISTLGGKQLTSRLHASHLKTNNMEDIVLSYGDKFNLTNGGRDQLSIGSGAVVIGGRTCYIDDPQLLGVIPGQYFRVIAELNLGAATPKFEVSVVHSTSETGFPALVQNNLVDTNGTRQIILWAGKLNGDGTIETKNRVTKLSSTDWQMIEDFKANCKDKSNVIINKFPKYNPNTRNYSAGDISFEWGGRTHTTRLNSATESDKNTLLCKVILENGVYSYEIYVAKESSINTMISNYVNKDFEKSENDNKYITTIVIAWQGDSLFNRTYQAQLVNNEGFSGCPINKTVGNPIKYENGKYTVAKSGTLVFEVGGRNYTRKVGVGDPIPENSDATPGLNTGAFVCLRGIFNVKTQTIQIEQTRQGAESWSKAIKVQPDYNNLVFPLYIDGIEQFSPLMLRVDNRPIALKISNLFSSSQVVDKNNIAELQATIDYYGAKGGTETSLYISVTDSSGTRTNLGQFSRAKSAIPVNSVRKNFKKIGINKSFETISGKQVLKDVSLTWTGVAESEQDKDFVVTNYNVNDINEIAETFNIEYFDPSASSAQVLGQGGLQRGVANLFLRLGQAYYAHQYIVVDAIRQNIEPNKRKPRQIISNSSAGGGPNSQYSINSVNIFSSGDGKTLNDIQYASISIDTSGKPIVVGRTGKF